ncbi:hypothetical protein HQ545_00890 [Candidatus Woesearchaeota archaeon]|nr:hypothetical protein [Candidatus Woesearchaeota archaeon]
MVEVNHYMCCEEVEVYENGFFVSMSLDDFVSCYPKESPTSLVHDNPECMKKYYRFAAGDNAELYQTLMDNYVSRNRR